MRSVRWRAIANHLNWVNSIYSRRALRRVVMIEAIDDDDDDDLMLLLLLSITCCDWSISSSCHCVVAHAQNAAYSVLLYQPVTSWQTMLKLRGNVGKRRFPTLFFQEGTAFPHCSPTSGRPGGGTLIVMKNLNLSVTISCHHFRKKNPQEAMFYG